MTTRLEYLEHFLDSVDFVTSGRKGAISDDRWLRVNYDSSFSSVLEKHLRNPDERVRAEVVSLLTTVKERSVTDTIRDMRMNDCERVGIACLGYLTSMDESDNLIPQLIETMSYERGIEFKKAAERIGRIGRSSEIPELRRIYGQVTGDMRSQTKEAMTKIIDRDPDLLKKKTLLLSIPVFPNEKEFDVFVRSSTEYMNVRYRNSVHPRKIVSVSTYNNVVRGLRNIRVRLFNESFNLVNYSNGSTERYNEIVDLLMWTASDLEKKEVDHPTEELMMMCQSCGDKMIRTDSGWRCMGCGYKKA